MRVSRREESGVVQSLKFLLHLSAFSSFIPTVAAWIEGTLISPASDWSPHLWWASSHILEKETVTHSVSSPGKSRGQRSLVSCSPWGCKGSGTTERLASSHIPCWDPPVHRKTADELRSRAPAYFSSVITPVCRPIGMRWFVGNFSGCSSGSFRNNTWNADVQSR